ncbi:MAG: SurA N-terminal domain-containing protein [Acidobacteriia bacterium]|nr:SurA N-terminal domain-containing protein [Terriglobia bacterium]
MRANRLLQVALCFVAGAAAADVVDRVAVVVGNSVITESEVQQELRLTQLVNGEPPDTGPEQRRAAAERLVDQQLLRNEIEQEHFSPPEESEIDGMLRKFRQERFPGDGQFQAALQKYGLTEKELKQHFAWQLTVLRFTDSRFRAGVPEAPEQGANRLRPGATDGAGVDEQMDAWLKDSRSHTRIVFKKGAFQ